jgi:SAM-dependent methyltransferase
LADRYRTACQLVEDVPFADGSFDLITSISVIEHIPDEQSAIATMWRLLRPGGRLIVTMPCAREAEEEYTNLDEYALFPSDRQGFVYWQRYYDRAALEDRIFTVTGKPVRMEIYGEKTRGSYDANVLQKRTNPSYPYWWEPAMMGRDYKFYDSIDDLPGMGVVALEFRK